MKEFETINRTWKNISWDISGGDDPTEALEYYNSLIEAREKLVLASKDDESLLNTEIFEDLNMATNSMSESLDDGTAPAMLEESNDKLGTMNDELGNANQEVGNVNSSLDETASTTSDVATNVSDANTNISESVGLVNDEKDAFSELKQIIDEVISAIELKTQAVQEEQNTVELGN